VEMDMKTLIGNAGSVQQLIEQGKGGKWKKMLGGQAPAGESAGQNAAPASKQPATSAPEKLIPSR